MVHLVKSVIAIKVCSTPSPADTPSTTLTCAVEKGVKFVLGALSTGIELTPGDKAEMDPRDFLLWEWIGAKMEVNV